MKILKYPVEEKLLRKPGGKITPEDITADFLSKLQSLKNLLKLDGMGLAATQVGWSVQMFLLSQDENLKEIEPQIFINPIILSVSKELDKDSEGCLSFPGLFVDIARPAKVVWQYQDLNFNMYTKESSGYYARAVIHEINHLNGRLMIDDMTNVQGLKFKRWLKDVKR